jgi:hypothetical protein
MKKLKIHGITITPFKLDSGEILRPVIYQGQIVPDYFVDHDGFIWSGKVGNCYRMLAASCSGEYPHVRLRFTNNVSKTVRVHRLVCESFHNFPVPNGITQKAWSRTPASVKNLLRSCYCVNHIDHDKFNYHPDNLEWVSYTENAHKYQIHRRGKL